MRRKSFDAGGNTMVYDRGRYKTKGAVGSVSEGKDRQVRKAYGRLDATFRGSRPSGSDEYRKSLDYRRSRENRAREEARLVKLYGAAPTRLKPSLPDPNNPAWKRRRTSREV